MAKVGVKGLTENSTKLDTQKMNNANGEINLLGLAATGRRVEV